MLVNANLSLLAGSESLIVASFPIVIVAVGFLGAAFAHRIRRRSPELYANLGRAFEG